jgi:HAD superfamily hydrolase (TIGR01509 family)
MIFDFDGLILDTETPTYRTWQEIYQEHGHELDLAIWAATIGHQPGLAPWDPHRHLEELIGRALDRDEIRARRRPRSDALIELELPRPGVERWLVEARELGLRLAVASSSPREWVEGHLVRLDLRGAFEAVLCAGGELRGKPWPDVYLGALAALDVPAHEAIAIEDSSTGVAAARAAGIYTVAVPNDITAGMDFADASLRLTSLADMTVRDLLSLQARS